MCSLQSRSHCISGRRKHVLRSWTWEHYNLSSVNTASITQTTQPRNYLSSSNQDMWISPCPIFNKMSLSVRIIFNRLILLLLANQTDQQPVMAWKEFYPGPTVDVSASEQLYVWQYTLVSVASQLVQLSLLKNKGIWASSLHYSVISNTINNIINKNSIYDECMLLCVWYKEMRQLCQCCKLFGAWIYLKSNLHNVQFQHAYLSAAWWEILNCVMCLCACVCMCMFYTVFFQTTRVRHFFVKEVPQWFFPLNIYIFFCFINFGLKLSVL